MQARISHLYQCFPHFCWHQEILVRCRGFFDTGGSQRNNLWQGKQAQSLFSACRLPGARASSANWRAAAVMQWCPATAPTHCWAPFVSKHSLGSSSVASWMNATSLFYNIFTTLKPKSPAHVNWHVKCCKVDCFFRVNLLEPKCS